MMTAAADQGTLRVEAGFLEKCKQLEAIIMHSIIYLVGLVVVVVVILSFLGLV